MAPVKNVVETRYTDKEKLLEKLKAIFPYEANASFKIRVSMIYLDAFAVRDCTPDHSGGLPRSSFFRTLF